ncbi:hypothetical protein AALA17_02205 [Lactobacillaceae bacterium 24-114]
MALWGYEQINASGKMMTNVLVRPDRNAGITSLLYYRDHTLKELFDI